MLLLCSVVCVCVLGDVAVLTARKDVTLLRKNYMSIMKVRKDVMILQVKWNVAILSPYSHVKYLIKKGGISITKIRTDVTLLKEERVMSILRVSKAVRLLVQMGIFL